jgi:hypothetical protein
MQQAAYPERTDAKRGCCVKFAKFRNVGDRKNRLKIKMLFGKNQAIVVVNFQK